MSVSAPVKLTLKDYKSDLHNDWCPGCVLPETSIILADGTSKPIAQIRVGDEVLGHDGRSHRVSQVMSHWHPDTLRRLSVCRNGSLTLTADHPVYVARIDPVAETLAFEWTPAGAVRPGDQMLRPFGSPT